MTELPEAAKIVLKRLPAWAVSSIKRRQPTTLKMRITKRIAERFMTLNTRNRSKKECEIERVRKAIDESQFALTHQGIAFDWNSVLLDGQNRLEGIIRSKLGEATVLVTFNLDPESQKYIDDGSARKPVDKLKLTGRECMGTLGAGVVCFIGSYGYGRTKLRTDELEKYFDLLIEGMRFVEEGISGHTTRGIFLVPVIVPIIRAYYKKGVSKSRLREFIEVLKTGQRDDMRADSAAWVLREKMLTDREIVGKRDASSRETTYRRATSMLSLFLKRKHVKRVSLSDKHIHTFNWERSPYIRPSEGVTIREKYTRKDRKKTAAPEDDVEIMNTEEEGVA